MKVIKITAMWCSSCLLMNRIYKKINSKYNFETINLDIDMDEDKVLKYGDIDKLPVFIFLDNDLEKLRIIGEISEENFEKRLKEVFK